MPGFLKAPNSHTFAELSHSWLFCRGLANLELPLNQQRSLSPCDFPKAVVGGVQQTELPWSLENRIIGESLRFTTLLPPTIKVRS